MGPPGPVAPTSLMSAGPARRCSGDDAPRPPLPSAAGPPWCRGAPTPRRPGAGAGVLRAGRPREPLGPDAYDHEAAVLWNAHAGALWRRFSLYLRREAAQRAGLTQRAFCDPARISFAKVAESQKRGAVHFHAVIRLDGPEGGETSPPAWATAELLSDAVHAAATAARVSGPTVDGRAHTFVFLSVFEAPVADFRWSSPTSGSRSRRLSDHSQPVPDQRGGQGVGGGTAHCHRRPGRRARRRDRYPLAAHGLPPRLRSDAAGGAGRPPPSGHRRRQPRDVRAGHRA